MKRLRLLSFVTGLKDLAIFFWTQDFSRALSKLHVIAWNSDWFIARFAPVVIGVIALVLVFRQSFETLWVKNGKYDIHQSDHRSIPAIHTALASLATD